MGVNQLLKVFPPFRLDPANQCLWRNGARIPLAPKAFAVLRYLVDHPNRLVTQDEILEAIWPETYVQPELLRKYILDLRKILGDSPKAPLFIETLPKRGYRFVAPVTEEAAPEEAPPSALALIPPGREPVLVELDRCLNKVLQGQRQVVFVTGEAGIGKTTVADAFERRARRHARVRFARGQCLEGFGGKEAYYPVFEALGQLMHSQSAEPVMGILADQAPTWLIQFPPVLKPEERDALQREILGATRERMLREICEALEAMGAVTPLIITLEDLHWADHSTLDLISALARRRGPAKLLLLATYQPVEAELSQSPLNVLKQDLLIHRLCQEIALERLAESDVKQYLAAEAAQSDFPEELAGLVYRRSDGNPMFMCAIVEDLVKKGFLRKHAGAWALTAPVETLVPGVPETLQQLIALQIDRLEEREQRVLKCASIAGPRFSTWAIASMTDLPLHAVEEICQRLAQRQQFIRPAAPHGIPGSPISAPYEFRHALYHEALCRQVPPGFRSELHRTLAGAIEGLASSSPPEFVSEMASELASHFEKGRLPERAAPYLAISAENAARRYAHAESVQILNHALDLVANVSSEKARKLHIEILEKLSDAHYALGQMVESAEADARAAGAAAGWGMTVAQVNALTRAARALGFLDPDKCVTHCERAAEVAAAGGDPLLAARTRMFAACWRIITNGWRREDAEICRAAREDIQRLNSLDLPAYYEVLYAHVQLIQGEYLEAYKTAEAGIPKSVEARSLVVYLSALYSKALALLFLGRWGELRRVIETGIQMAEKNGNDPWAGIFGALLAWLHLAGFDLPGARQMAEALLKRSEESARYAQTLARVITGYADLQIRDIDSALGQLLEVRERPASPKFFLTWYWKLMAQYGIARARIVVGDLGKAATEAEQFHTAAVSTADPALKTMAWEIKARVAKAEGEAHRACEHIDRAVSAMENVEPAPVAWRVHATAAQIHALAGDRDRAEHHRSCARTILQTLADSLDRDDPLREPLLQMAAKFRSSGASTG